VRAHDSARIPLGFRADSAWNPGGFRLDSAGPNPTRAQPNPSLYLTLAFSSFSGLRLFASEPHLITGPTRSSKQLARGLRPLARHHKRFAFAMGAKKCRHSEISVRTGARQVGNVTSEAR
jgi:hypothetical protein